MVPKVYDRNMTRLAYLENASGVGYNLLQNSISTARFTLPIDDPKNEYCTPLNFVEIFDGDTYIGLFRIIGQQLVRAGDQRITYNCEHVFATLLNNILFRQHKIGSAVEQTRDVLEYILSFQENWDLGECDFSRKFEYSFENQTLLEALLSVPACFDEEYQWTYNTTVYPWVLNLVKPSDDLAGEIRYKKNLVGITRTKDASQIVNRVYALGYGEGVNQLNLEAWRTAAGSHPYVEDLTSQAQYGLAESIIVDQRIEHEETLWSYANRMLTELKQPYYSYEVQAVDLFRLAGDETGQFLPGRLIRVIDDEDGITLRTRIVQVGKDDVDGDPGAITVTLANKERNIAGSLSDLQSRTFTNETCAQGATNLIPQVYIDNADTTHPAVFNVWIPAAAARINKVFVSINLEPYRVCTAAGITEGTTADTITVTVDGTTLPDPGTWENVDLVEYLDKTEDDIILRDTWHTIEIAPDAPSRIVAALYMQIFTNSQGGGDY